MKTGTLNLKPCVCGAQLSLRDGIVLLARLKDQSQKATHWGLYPKGPKSEKNANISRFCHIWAGLYLKVTSP